MKMKQLGPVVAVAGISGLLGTPAMAEVLDIYAELSGENESTSIESAAGGELSGTYDTDTMVLEWTVTYHDMTGPLTGAHIHGPAEPGENAGIVIAFDGIEQSPFSGSTELVDEEVGFLMDGLFYANLHTAAHPGGEIRGHLMVVEQDMMN